MSNIEQLCRCLHLSSDHEILADLTPEQLSEWGSPCNRCNADPREEQRRFYDVFCTSFRELDLMGMPWPGTFAARELGCECPVGSNLKAQKEGLSPIYDDTCSVHDWVCKLTTTCVHTDAGTAWEFRHDRPHESCEHCTIPRIVCGGCGQVWTDWRVPPERNGWRRELSGGELICGCDAPKLDLWRCASC